MDYWVSSRAMTFLVRTTQNDGTCERVAWAPNIAKKFIGQPLGNLIAWMEKQGGFRMEKLSKKGQ